jgi:hypothetical protein
MTSNRQVSHLRLVPAITAVLAATEASDTFVGSWRTMTTVRPPSWQFTDLPAALKPLIDKDNWLLWRWELNDKRTKWTKVPYQANGSKASSIDPQTWASYAKITAAFRGGGFDGIGFALSGDIAALDVDDCIDKETGQIQSWSRDLVARSGSYCEKTISGEGLRIIGFGIGEKIHKKLRVDETVTCEVYRTTGRYIVMTGHFLGDSPSRIVNIDAVIDSVMTELGTSFGVLPIATVADIEAKFAELDPQPIERDDPRLENVSKEWIALGFTAAGIEEKFDGNRSNAIFGFACHCLKNGISENVTASCLWHWKIGEHIHDQQYPKRALVRAVVRAALAVQTFETDGNGKMLKNPYNIRLVVAKMNFELSYDVFRDVAYIAGLPGYTTLDDPAITEVRFKIERRFRFLTPKELFFDVTMNMARGNGFHPVLNYLDSLRWDETRRLDEWLITYGGAESSDYVRAVGSIMMIAAVRRIRTPGCKFDEMVVLESARQGTLKSTLLSTIAVHEDWFTDDLPLNADSRESIEQLRGKWIVEAAELSGMRRADVEHLKAFLSRQNDRGRMAYDRTVTDRPRQCIVIGTTNSSKYLRDQTGNRRFWPIKIVGDINIADLRRDRDQLWAEAAAREAAGSSIRLDQSLWPLAEREQEERTVAEPWYEVIREHLSDDEGNIVTGAILSNDIWSLVGMDDVGRRQQDHNQRIGNIMRSLGFARDRVRVEGVLGHFYLRGTQEERRVRVHVGEGM